MLEDDNFCLSLLEFEKTIQIELPKNVLRQEKQPNWRLLYVCAVVEEMSHIFS